MYDHAVFVTYSISFMTLLFVALALLGACLGCAALVIVAAAVRRRSTSTSSCAGTYGLTPLRRDLARCWCCRR